MSDCFDIIEYGACPDGKTMNTVAIQKAIDACHQAGGGTVLCGPGSFLTGSLELKSDVELHLASGCRIIGSPNLEDYEELKAPGFLGSGGRAPEKSALCLVRAIGAERVAITGLGEINGSGPAFYDPKSADASGKFQKPSTPRPRIVMFYKCRNVRFEDSSFVDSPCWTFWLMQCRDVNVHRVNIRGDRRLRNVDGIDVDACSNVTVSDSIFDTEDDCLAIRAMKRLYDDPAVCENIAVNNCVLKSGCQGVRVGCPSDGVIRNCSFSNLVISSANNGVIFNNPAHYLAQGCSGSAEVRSITFSNVVVECVREPVRIDVGAGIALSYLGDISFSGFRIKSGGPVVIQGSPETIVRNVSFSDIDVETSGGDAVLCRFCEGVRMSNVELSNTVAGI